MNPNLNTTPNNDGQHSSDPVTPANDNLQPAPPAPMAPVAPMPAPPAPQAQAHMPVTAGDAADPKSRLAMVAFAFFAAPTGAARAYIGDKSGVVRFWMYIICVILSVIPLVNILTGLIIFVLAVWGIIDYFLLKGRLVDAHGQQLYSSNRDDRFIKYLNIFFYISLVLGAIAVIGAILAISMGAFNAISERAKEYQNGNTSSFEHSVELSL